MKEIKKGGNMQTSISINEYRVNCRKNEEKNAQVNESSNKYTMTDSISMKDIFKYESRFSASDEFDELW